jgi:beta-glucosidase
MKKTLSALALIFAVGLSRVIAQTPPAPKVDEKAFQEKSGSMLTAPAGALTAGVTPTGVTSAKADASAAIEKIEASGKFQKMHAAFLERGKAGPIGVLFLGDSITEGWSNPARAHIWEKFYGAMSPANFGIGGDRTQHVIWRIEHGELDGLHPKVVVFMLGTNNSADNTAEEIAAADQKIVGMIRAKIPETKILLLAIFPRGARKDAKGVVTDASIASATKLTGVINAANAELAKLDDGLNVRFLDIGAVFLGQDGKIPWTIMPDQLHPTAAGYQLWAEAMQKPLAAMMK